MTEFRRLLVEASGAMLILAGLVLIWVPAALIVAGCILLLVANVYMGDDDAGTESDN